MSLSASVDGHKAIVTVVVDEHGDVTVKKPAKFSCKMGTGSRGKPAVVYSVVGLEVGTEQPSFAVLAANDGAGDQVDNTPALWLKGLIKLGESARGQG